MKKHKRILIAALIIIGFLALFGIHVPFIAGHIHKQIKVGQSVEEVTGIVSGFIRKPDASSWRVEGTETRFYAGRQCTFPSDKIKFDGKTDNINLELCYVGPGFLKNDFYVTFNGYGKVVFVSDIRQWD